MTEADSVHSTPPLNTSASNIIDFASAAARSARKAIDKPAAVEVTAIGDSVLTPGQRRRLAKPELPPTATQTAKNSRLRSARRDAWWRASRLTEYWRACLDWQSALGIAQQYGLADSASLPPAENRFGLVDKWREALVKQLLTPAPDVAAINWKRAQLAGRGFGLLPVKAQRIEQVIADDVAFLDAHPTRRSRRSQQ